MRYLLIALTLSASAFAQTTVRFSVDPGDTANSAYSAGPFPTNVLVVPDSGQATGVRVNLPSSNDGCLAQPAAVCSYSSLVNQLDGFSVNPRLMVCFSGPVDIPTLGNGITIFPVGANGKSAHQPVAVDRVIFDSSTNCAYAKPAHVLNQQSSYLLTVNNSITSGGQPVAADPQYKSCASGHGGGYCVQLATALAHNGPKGTPVGASLFTTMSVTPWIQAAQDVASDMFPVNLPAGSPSYIPLNQIQTLTYYPAQSGLPPQSIPISDLGGVGAVSFGILFSPSYLNTQGPAAGTITTSPYAPVGSAAVSYHVFLPASAKGKIPVVLYAHGSGDTQFGAPTFLASTLAKNGFATLAFEIPGHGFGVTSSVAATLTNGTTVYESTPGRGVPMGPGTPLSSESGCVIPGPIGLRDCVRQSAVDVFSLINLIRSTNGLGLNLDPSRIFIVGQSLGSLIASTALPIDPNLRAAVLSGDGGTSVDIARLSPSARLLAEAFLASIQNPSLLNVAAGLAPPETYFSDAFNDNYVFSAIPPQTYTIAYSPNIQAAFEAADWLGMLADPVAFGPYTASQPLPGVPPKPVLFQIGIGDSEVPNPTETAAVQDANAQGAVSILNFPLAVSISPGLASVEDPAIPGFPILPHRILANPTLFLPGNGPELSISLALQEQLVGFFASNGHRIPDPNQYLTAPFTPSSDLFVTGPLPTQLNYPPAP